MVCTLLNLLRPVLRRSLTAAFNLTNFTDLLARTLELERDERDEYQMASEAKPKKEGSSAEKARTNGPSHDPVPQRPATGDKYDGLRRGTTALDQGPTGWT